MTDSFGRELDYLRISLTDRCNLRCSYCMPAEGVKNIPHCEILTLEENARIARVMASLGVKKIRLTGGEPLIRKNVVRLIEMINDTDGIDEICLTTNGLLLSGNAAALRKAGLSRVNISLDTLDEAVFRRITRSEEQLDRVLDGIAAAVEENIATSINCVPMAGVNDSELDRIALFSEKAPVDVRFIELMPIGRGRTHKGISSAEVLKKLEERFGKAELLPNDGHSPAMYYCFGGFVGRTGFISPMSHKFCDSCNRLRLTSDGFLKLCLQYPQGIDLKSPLRNGCTDRELADIISEAVKMKPREHSFCDTDMTDKRKMVQIGG